jgi:predicted transcriptional regulator
MQRFFGHIAQRSARDVVNGQVRPCAQTPRPERPECSVATARNQCYDQRVITALKNMLPQIDRWPSEDQEALLEAARSIEAERAGAYHATEAELAAIDRGLDDARAGRFASADAAAKVRAKFRAE